MFRSDQSAVTCWGRRRRWFAQGQLCLLALALATAYPGLAEAGPGSSPPAGGAPQSATPNNQPTSPDKANPPADGAKQLAPRPQRPRGCPYRERSLNLIV
jgi:hypothetical protein